MVPELLQGRRRKSNIGENGGNEQEEEEEEGGSDDEEEEEIKPEVSEIKMELDAGQNIRSDREALQSSSNASGATGNNHGRAERPSVIMFQRSSEHSAMASHVQTQREGGDGERSPMPEYGDMAVSGDKHFSMWSYLSREIPLFPT